MAVRRPVPIRRTLSASALAQGALQAMTHSLSNECDHERDEERRVDEAQVARDNPNLVSEFGGRRNLTRAHRQALTRRTDLLAKEAQIVSESRLNWRGRLAQLGDYGRRGGGSASDRRLIVEAMAAMEASH